MLVFYSFICVLNAQEPVLQSGYINPVDIPVRLSGTFCELRFNHFHAGIDIKTQSVEGKVIRAVQDGYVSRILVSTTGYGKALYIAHPNGRTSVYAHLQRFESKIEEYVKKAQYQKESFEIELFPEKDVFVLRQGDTIAFSGNSGGSEGPHLHFEIRETATQVPIDPLSNGFKVKDFIRPTLTLLKMYPQGPGSHVNGFQNPKEFFLAGWGPVYRLRDYDTVLVGGKASLGLMAYDLLNDESNKNGYYSSDLYVDSVLMMSYDFARMPFDETRYIHSLCDFAEYQLTGRWIPQTRIQPGNKLSAYKTTKNNGIYEFKEGRTYKIKYVIKDYYQNESILTFYVKGQKLKNPKPLLADKCNKLLEWKSESIFETADFKFISPIGAFYDTVHFFYSTKKSSPAYYSSYHNVHRKTTPIQAACTIMIKPNGLRPEFYDKALVVRINDKGSAVSAGGKYENGWVSTTIRTFGTYSVLIDTIKPSIKPLNISQSKNIAKQSTIKVCIRDNLSGIKSYRGTLNNKWILMEYDAKEALLTYFIDPAMLKPSNVFMLEVTDQKNNSAVIMLNLSYLK
jgi:murein DD-endopeptidase MepM/ murein hydrolase activator NlpD